MTSSTGTWTPSRNADQSGAASSSMGGLWPIDRDVKAVNLIPSGQRVAGGKSPSPVAAKPKPASTPVGAYVILAALVFAIAASALYVTTKNGITDKKNELAQVQRDAETAKAQASQFQSFADFKQLASSRVETIKGLA